jgi:hypothetical protein
MNITFVLLKIDIIFDLQNVILKYLSKTHIRLLNKEKNLIIEEMIKYDPNIIISYIQRLLYVHDDIIESIISFCAKYGLFNHLKWFKTNNYTLNKKTFKYAALSGNIEIMKWLHKSKCSHDPYTFAYAAKNGNLENMEWLLNNGFRYNSFTFVYAAENGNLTNLEWLHKNNFCHDSNTLSYAAKNGNLDNIKWLVKNGFKYDSWVIFKALENGNLENIAWLIENLYNKKIDVKFTDKSQVIKYLIKQHILEINKHNFFDDVVINGNLEMMKLLFENGFEYSNHVFEYAVENGNLENMKWLLKNNFSLNENISNLAIILGNLDNIIWLYENNCPFNRNSLIKAIEFGKNDVIDWMLKNKFPVKESEIKKMTINNISIIKSLRRHNLYFPIESDINIDFVLKSLESQNYKEIYENAFEKGTIKGIAILLINNVPYDIKSFKKAIKNNKIKFGDFLLLSHHEKRKILRILVETIKYD